MARDMQVIWVKREREYFCEGGLDDPNQPDFLQQIRFYGCAKKGIGSSERKR
jgi:hypothetical protein